MSYPDNIPTLKNKLLTLFRRFVKSGKYGWSGNHASWDVALKNSGGYDQAPILQKIKEATLKIKSGEAKYERDSVLFDKIQYSWPLLASLLWIATKNNGRISVIDFGGSLGSSYFQNQKFLSHLKDVKWTVVEQKNFVAAGSAEIADQTLQFSPSISSSIEARGLPDILIISCTLPYLEKPYDFITDLFQYNIPYMVIDNTFFNYEAEDRITIQTIHPVIYPASYPCWFLDYDKVKEVIEQKYAIIEEYQNELSIYLDGHKIQYRGMIAKLK
ncbi:MAG: methyltransferase, TIGR04325 family [Flavitalea sp.]